VWEAVAGYRDELLERWRGEQEAWAEAYRRSDEALARARQ
jgi:hypothetical protein